ncbi:MAG: hypothetical protein JWP27_3100 [Flaviaesturariibacter sp.]|nr:hypothetical protein [Flaviaesturariibacter sp.]
MLFENQVFGDGEVERPSQPGHNAVGIHRPWVEARDDDIFPGAQGDGGEGEGEASVHIGLVLADATCHGMTPGAGCKEDPEDRQQAEGHLGRGAAVGEDADIEPGWSAQQQDGEDIHAAVEPVDARCAAEDGFGKLGEACRQGEQGREHVDVEGGEVARHVDDLLLDAEEGGVCSGRDVLSDDAEHEPAKEEVEEEQSRAGGGKRSGRHEVNIGIIVRLVLYAIR